MDRLAILASTLARAVQLAQTPRDEETTRSAASVVGQALDFAPVAVRDQIALELRAENQLGDGPTQFPAWPWVMWEDDRIFRVLKAADLGDKDEILRNMPLDQFLRMTPAMLFAAFGAPHQAVRLPTWAQYTLAGLALAATAAGVAALQQRGR